MLGCDPLAFAQTTPHSAPHRRPASAQVVSSLEKLKDSGQEAGPEDERTLCDLMLDQVRGALWADWG